MPFYVYLLINKKDDKLISYVGYTRDLKKRVNLHNSSKGAKFTRGRTWILAYKQKYLTKNKAMKEEYLLKKNYKKRNFIKKKFINL